MKYTFTKIADHGTANPIVARLTVQIFSILDHCTLSKEASDRFKLLYMDSLRPKLMRCWEIRERYRIDFNEKMASYERPPSPHAVVSVPRILRLEEEWHNFLYEAKNFVRDALQVFNGLFGTGFEEASEYCWIKKGKKTSLLDFAESNFGAKDPRTQSFKAISKAVERVVTFRNAVEHPRGHFGVLRIQNIDLLSDGRIAEPCWWIEKNGQSTPKSSIRGDSGGIIDALLALGEGIVVSWANENLRFKQFLQIVAIPEEERDPDNPVQFVVTAFPC